MYIKIILPHAHAIFCCSKCKITTCYCVVIYIYKITLPHAHTILCCNKCILK